MSNLSKESLRSSKTECKNNEQALVNKKRIYIRPLKNLAAKDGERSARIFKCLNPHHTEGGKEDRAFGERSQNLEMKSNGPPPRRGTCINCLSPDLSG